MTKNTLSILATTAALALSAFASPALAQSACNWAGTWDTDLGELEMTQDGNRVSGTFTQLYKTRIMGPVSQSNGQCVGDLTVMGRNVDAGAMRGKRIVLSGNTFSGAVSDSLNDNVTMTRFTGARQVKTYELAPLAVEKVQRGVVADNKVLNNRVNERAVVQKLDQPMVKLKSTTKADQVLRNTDETKSSLPIFEPGKTQNPYKKHIPALAGRRDTFAPKFIELELLDFKTVLNGSANVFGIMGFYAGCMSDLGNEIYKPLGGQKNRFFSESELRNSGPDAAIIKEPSRNRTRRFILEMSCYDKPGGELYVQAQTNFKEHVNMQIDPEYGYRGFVVYLSDLLTQDDGLVNDWNNPNGRKGFCLDSHINKTKPGPGRSTSTTAVFDWHFTAASDKTHSRRDECVHAIESHVEIRLVE